MAIPVEIQQALAAKFEAVFPHLDERQRRLPAGAEARGLSHGGIRVVAKAAGKMATGAGHARPGQELKDWSQWSADQLRVPEYMRATPGESDKRHQRLFTRLPSSRRQESSRSCGAVPGVYLTVIRHTARMHGLVDRRGAAQAPSATVEADRQAGKDLVADAGPIDPLPDHLF